MTKPINYKPEKGAVMPGGVEYQAFRYAMNRDQNLARAAANWRRAFFLCLMFCAFSVGWNYWQSTQSQLIPYVVEVREGEAAVVAPAAQAVYTPREEEVKYFLWQFVDKLRSLPQDRVLLKKNWSDAYAFASDPTSAKIAGYMRDGEMKKRIAEDTVAVSLRSITKSAGNSYQIRWTETRFSADGKIQDKANMYGLFTVSFAVPKDEKALRVNPLGVMITDYNWSKEI